MQLNFCILFLVWGLFSFLMSFADSQFSWNVCKRRKMSMVLTVLFKFLPTCQQKSGFKDIKAIDGRQVKVLDFKTEICFSNMDFYQHPTLFCAFWPFSCKNCKYVSKGQLISKYPFGFIVWTKIPTKNLTNFCSRI